MSEQLIERITRVEFAELELRDKVRIITGTGEDAYTYDFVVSELGRWPLGVFTETRPDGSMTEPAQVELHGCGSHTTRDQNPCQDAEKAFTPYWDGLIVGKFMVIANPAVQGPESRLFFDYQGQEITEITVEKS